MLTSLKGTETDTHTSSDIVQRRILLRLTPLPLQLPRPPHYLRPLENGFIKASFTKTIVSFETIVAIIPHCGHCLLRSLFSLSQQLGNAHIKAVRRPLSVPDYLRPDLGPVHLRRWVASGCDAVHPAILRQELTLSMLGTTRGPYHHPILGTMRHRQGSCRARRRST